ncbi:MAG: dihydropteroate synthase [Sphingobacteriales bacterium]|nr:MAG: dihydropteroate synthase [Sphingobacteriales bacterium]
MLESEFLPVKKNINCGGRLVSLDEPKIMGILNLTPDSFYDGGKLADENAVLKQAEKMLKEGATFLDIGGYSTRPGADEVSIEEEKKRVIPAMEILVKNFPEAFFSIDTYSSEVAREAIAAGAHIINDVSAGDDDSEMFQTVTELQVPYIIMHKNGSPKTMQIDPQYEDVVKEVIQYLSFKLEKLNKLGVHDVIVDPGFGFGKNLEHNYQLLKNLNLFRMLGVPVLAGVSRKRMINQVLKTKPENALNGTTVANTLALLQGASILRVHDVKEAREAVKIVTFYRETI